MAGYVLGMDGEAEELASVTWWLRWCDGGDVVGAEGWWMWWLPTSVMMELMNSMAPFITVGLAVSPHIGDVVGGVVRRCCWTCRWCGGGNYHLSCRFAVGVKVGTTVGVGLVVGVAVRLVVVVT